MLILYILYSFFDGIYTIFIKATLSQVNGCKEGKWNLLKFLGRNT